MERNATEYLEAKRETNQKVLWIRREERVKSGLIECETEQEESKYGDKDRGIVL